MNSVFSVDFLVANAFNVSRVRYKNEVGFNYKSKLK